MERTNILLPAMGEGVIEASVTKWLVAEGSFVNEDDPIVEVATDKVDSEIPSPVSGTLVSIIAKEGTIAKIGEIIAIIENDKKDDKKQPSEKVEKEIGRIKNTIEILKKEKTEIDNLSGDLKSKTPSGKFLSPLVRSIASSEGIGYSELEGIKGTGMDGRITKNDILGFIKNKKDPEKIKVTTPDEFDNNKVKDTLKTTFAAEDEIIPMDRIRRLIAEHMVMSKKTSPHVTSFIDADVTHIVEWRNANKDSFMAKEGQKLTLTPFFINATAMALYELPMINISVDGTNIIKRKNINIGMATALPDGNLIVPVIKNANEKSLTGLAKSVNDLAERARNNKLKPDEITGGTFSVTNFGSFMNLTGTPIINQPQTAILGTGVVKKMPVVIETKEGDAIAIRHIMILSLSYDHRVIDGALAGKFLQKVKEILENFSPSDF
jgi:2-oxoglutarate dehydrogenase E2 component (dihydrolipoamide succinyltransferase)